MREQCPQRPVGRLILCKDAGSNRPGPRGTHRPVDHRAGHARRDDLDHADQVLRAFVLGERRATTRATPAGDGTYKITGTKISQAARFFRTSSGTEAGKSEMFSWYLILMKLFMNKSNSKG